ncbi:MAG: UvrB/UvrC motif-containing protein, partial [Planctomycetota bacterium]|nr:UvrB/UvrC motif-containing protein [Planctomycetota bacterium]
MSKLTILLSLITLSWIPLQFSGGNPYVEKYINASQRHFDSGNYQAALEDIERALERDDQHFGALEQWAKIATAIGDNDTAAYAWHTWLNIAKAADRSIISRKKMKEAAENLEFEEAAKIRDEIRKLEASELEIGINPKIRQSKLNNK